MPTRLTLSLLAVCAVAAMTACGSERDDTSSGGTASTPTSSTIGSPAATPLPGTSWALASYQAAGGTTPASTDGLADLAFQAAGSLSGSTGCNRFFGSYEASGSSLTIQPVGTTQMACLTASLQDQETALVQLLPRVASYATTDGNLVLSDASGAVLLTYRPGIGGLEGTSWVATGVNNGRDAVEGTALTDALTATFGPEGTFSGFGGCNPLAGTYATTDEQGLTFTGIASGSASCGGEVDALEARYVAALNATTTYEITGEMLTLRDDSGAAQVMYRMTTG